MNPEPIVYYDEHIDLKIVLRHATINDGLRFEIWRGDAIQHLNGADTIERYARLNVHPTCCAAIDLEQSHIVIDGQSLTLPPDWEHWSKLPTVPVEVLNVWYQQAQALNPQWLAQDNSEKKESATNSINASPILPSHRGKKAKRSNTRT